MKYYYDSKLSQDNDTQGSMASALRDEKKKMKVNCHYDLQFLSIKIKTGHLGKYCNIEKKP